MDWHQCCFLSLGLSRWQEYEDHMDEELVLKNRIKEVRREKNMSQSKLADLVGVSRNTISSIETGQLGSTAKLALVICIALDKKFEDLFYF